ncbi:hypothetical protein HU200_064289 [Digitaria exilis]|uniref:Small ribosomal subunit protein uS8c n=1 Tax=Digitaria exilis TaxID=1010633 RepID=A0A835DVM4_9POAL|nr:hypothetical protein HU200_064289 [Digitaria exilis]
MIAMVHATKADGGAVCEQTVDATSGVEATELYPDVKFVTVQEYVNADRRGKATTLLQPISGVIVSFLNIMKHRGIPLLVTFVCMLEGFCCLFVVLKICARGFCGCFEGYIKNFEVTDPHRVGKINVELHGRIKDCKALTYRQDLRAKEIEQYRVRMLPTPQVLYLLISMDI